MSCNLCGTILNKIVFVNTAMIYLCQVLIKFTALQTPVSKYSNETTAVIEQFYDVLLLWEKFHSLISA